MAKNFIPFTKATNHEKKILQQHKKWYEKIYVSPQIEIGNTHYQILRTARLFGQMNLRKIVVFTKAGEVIKDSEITKDVFKVYTYFHYLNAFTKDIIADSKRDGQKQFKLLITSIKDIIDHLTEKVEEAELEALNNHLEYYYESQKLVDEVAAAAKKCIQVKGTLNGLKPQATIDDSLKAKLKEALYERENKRGQLEAMMLENSLNTSPTIKQILTKESYKAYVKNKESIERVVKEADYTKYLSYHLIQVGESDWAFDKQSLELNKGEFTVEKYIDELRNKNLGEIFIKTNITILMQDHWLFSATQQNIQNP
ncbi:MAG TPA: hypothetical protein VK079_04120 [Bacillota bacterium]|nr:hypothetical protein [Bacillota bacterium]